MVQFGHYELLRRIAVGGMAELFLCRSASLDGIEKLLTIKKIRPDLSGDPQFSSMFLNETRIASALRHPNIVLVVDYGRIDQCYYLAMEYVAGCDVDAVLGLRAIDHHGLEPACALYIIRAVCEALDYAHSRQDDKGAPLGIVHQDISPENILLSWSAGVKLADFGIAESRGLIADEKLRVPFGKLPYLAPEQFKAKATDARTDVFATGLVLWELLVGHPPCGYQVTRKDIIALHKSGVPRPSKHNPRLPAALDALVSRAVAIEPKARFGSARELASAIDEVMRAHYPRELAQGAQALAELLGQNRAELKEIHAARLAEVDPRATGPQAQALIEAEAKRQQARAAEKHQPDPRWSQAVNALIIEFRETPSLWLLLEMGRVCKNDGDLESAHTFIRAAALKFAEAKLLAPTAVCCRALFDLQPGPAARAEVKDIATFVSGGPTPKEPIYPVTAAGRLLRDLLTGVLATDDQSPRTRVATPLLSYLDAQAFTELAVSAPLLVFEPGENLVLEGQEGHTMYLICEGRVLVFATAGDGHRVYLSALTAGDFMGENSFFTGAPRSATVQAVTPVRAFELGREHYDRIVGTHQEAAMILMRFYKERIVETLLAKSPTLGLLPKEERTALVDHFTLSVFQPGATIIREGSRTRSIYLIKSGAASVYTEQDGERTAFSDIGPGTIFGEVAALRDIRRTATVAAKTEVEALELDGEVFAQALSRYPEVKSKIYAVGAERARANIDKIPGFGPNAKKS